VLLKHFYLTLRIFFQGENFSRRFPLASFQSVLTFIPYHYEWLKMIMKVLRGYGERVFTKAVFLKMLMISCGANALMFFDSFSSKLDFLLYVPSRKSAVIGLRGTYSFCKMAK
jgi:hypothetical protein